MRGRPPGVSVETVRAIRRIYDAVPKIGRRRAPWVKPIARQFGLSPRNTKYIAERISYGWVQ